MILVTYGDLLRASVFLLGEQVRVAVDLGQELAPQDCLVLGLEIVAARERSHGFDPDLFLVS